MNKILLSVDGQWSSWSVWSECAVSQRHLDVQKRTRQRECNSPPARHGGQPCSGDVIQTEQCPDTSTSADNKNSRKSLKYFKVELSPINELYVEQPA